MAPPLNEAANFLKTALSHPKVKKLITDNVSKFFKKNQKAGAAAAGATASKDQWKAYDQYNQNNNNSSSSSSNNNNNTNSNNNNNQGFAGRFKNFDWQNIQQKAFQFFIVNFMGVMMVFQIFNGVWQNYQKDKRLRDKRREQETRAYEQRGLVVEQMQQTQKLSQQLVNSQKGGGNGSSSNNGRKSDFQTAELLAKQQELDHRIHEASVAAVYQPISGVGVAEVFGFDAGGGSYTADIPVQVWIHDQRAGKDGETSEKSIVPFDPLLRWQGYSHEIRDRSYDPLTGLKGIAELKFNY
jgi:hypothetical protein